MIPNLLPPVLQPFAKAIYPFLVTLLTIGVNAAFGDPLDVDALKAAVLGIALAAVTFLVPNGQIDADQR
jgi:hypothetical protein